MLNIRLVELKENILRYLPVGGLIGIIFFLEIFLILRSDLIFLLKNNTTDSFQYITWINKIDTLTNTETLGQLIYTHYYYYFLVAGIILLVAMIGSIVLTLQKSVEIKRQEIYEQVSRDFLTTIKLKKF
jgi:NADH-ubiquinone oxidoreductase chain 6